MKTPNNKPGSFHAVVLAGGGGRQFWPWSRAGAPQQLLPMIGKPYPRGRTLLEITLERLRPMFPPQHIWMVTTEELAPKIARQAPRIPRGNILAEPLARGTAAAIALGATCAQARDPQATLAVFPTDALVQERKKFERIVRESGEQAAKAPLLILLGAPPTEPSPARGYLHVGDELPLGRKTKFFRVKRFVGKPDEERARGWIASGQWRWNTGMIIGSVQSFAQSLADFAPQLYAACGRWGAAIGKKHFPSLLRKEYEALAPISFDRAVLERAVNLIAAEADIGWDELDSWAAYARHQPRDPQGNALQGNVVAADARDCLVLNRGKKPIALAGASGFIVVETDDAILVTHRRAAHRVRNLVARLGESAATRKLL